MKADCGQGYCNGNDPSDEEDTRANVDPVGKVLEPAMHDPPCSGDRKQEGKDDQAEKIFGQDVYHILRGCAEHFADSDLFSPLQNIVSRQSHEPEARDEDG